MNKVFIVGAKRTAIGSFLGQLKDVSVPKMASEVIKSALEQSRVEPKQVNEVILGNVLSAGLGQGVARQAAIAADLPIDIPAYSLNMVCGSGLKTVANGYGMIQAGLSQAIIAAGAESMSGAPFLMGSSVRSGKKMGNMELIDSMLHDGLTDAFEGYHMGVTAENVAQAYNISREDQDVFAMTSQQKAIEAQKAGRFVDEIVSIKFNNKKGQEVNVTEDEYINHDSNLQKMKQLRTVFKKGGTVTAANASGLNDGASAVVLASQEMVEANELTPLAEIISVGQAGIDPSIMGVGPVEAIKKALDQANLTIDDIDLFELNEAFAAQSIAVVRQLAQAYSVEADNLFERTNVNGGAIALGHPIGASGNRILVTLIHEMRRRGAKYGLASLCIGGGMGLAVIIKAV